MPARRGRRLRDHTGRLCFAADPVPVRVQAELVARILPAPACERDPAWSAFRSYLPYVYRRSRAARLPISWALVMIRTGGATIRAMPVRARHIPAFLGGLAVLCAAASVATFFPRSRQRHRRDVHRSWPLWLSAGVAAVAALLLGLVFDRHGVSVPLALIALLVLLFAAGFATYGRPAGGLVGRAFGDAIVGVAGSPLRPSPPQCAAAADMTHRRPSTRHSPSLLSSAPGSAKGERGLQILAPVRFRWAE